MYATILAVLLEPHSTAHATAQFRFWAKRMFRLVTTPHANLVAHENRPVAVKDQIYHSEHIFPRRDFSRETPSLPLSHSCESVLTILAFSPCWMSWRYEPQRTRQNIGSSSSLLLVVAKRCAEFMSTLVQVSVEL